ncbi:MAG: HAD family hydrolase [Bacteroidota bacterium]
MILIWDIDGTLSDSSGAGIDALSRAISTHFNQPSPSLDLAGATDGGIYRSMCERYGRAFDAEEQQAFFDLYLPLLEENLSSGNYPATVYPTVIDTLEHFKAAGYTQALLTGNIEQGAYLKNKNCGIESYFPFGAYGCDHHDRNELGFIAAQRASKHLNTEVKPTDLLIIGDTIKDIACARASGAKVAAVTTGHGTREQLAGADWVIDSVSELIPLLGN